MKKTAAKILHTIFPTLTLAALTVQTSIFLAKTSFFFELFTHYAVYYAAAWTIVAAAAVAKKRFVCALLLLTAASINFAEIAPYLLRAQTEQAQTQAETTTNDRQTELNFSVLSSNFYYQNKNAQALLSLTQETNPTVLVIHEASEIWSTLLPEIQKTHPYAYLTEKTGIDGILVASRIPGIFTEIPLGHSFGLLFTPENGLVTPAAAATAAATALPQVLAVHPFAPLNAKLATERNKQFADLTVFAKKQATNKQPLIVIGDFNCTPWSPYFKDLLANSGLVDTRIGRGILPSWRSGFSLFKIPIDHALISSNLSQKVANFEVLPKIKGADHLPIEIKIY
jgi:endonuclease/exonuclease/phosphatase (EEP) superfamily protein YafD